MKRMMLSFCFVLILSSCASTVISIPPGERVELDYPGYQAYSATLKNKSLRGLEVSVRSKTDDSQVRGFGLGTVGKAVVGVEAGNKLVLQNPNDRRTRVALKIAESRSEQWSAPENSIGFILENKSAKAIPLIIPGVMNPNLSPMSKSGVNLAVGQEILFRYKGKTQVLLVVDRSIAEGSRIDVAALLKARKAEIDQ